MLENVDLSVKLSKQAYRQMRSEYSRRMFGIQKASWDARVPVVVLFEGWDAAGKGTSI